MRGISTRGSFAFLFLLFLFLYLRVMRNGGFVSGTTADRVFRSGGGLNAQEHHTLSSSVSLTSLLIMLPTYYTNRLDMVSSPKNERLDMEWVSTLYISEGGWGGLRMEQ
ncbi:hypothetical protein F4778DRAFT_713867 [Xylariomycetidae sp. FL2044]|nr:hypothetical protein F4778DRAFT_713867 [Xylariomycetidae sp. FL2044]